MYPIVSYTIPELVEKSSIHYADRPALAMVGGPPLLFEELEPRSRRLAALLGLYGIAQGDKVALVSENRPEWGLDYFGIVRLGASVVPILTDFTSEQMANIVAHSGAKAVIVSKKFLAKFSGGCKATFILSVEDLSLISGPEGFTAPIESEIAVATANFVPAAVKGDDLAAIVYTSGTTGLSKGVMDTARAPRSIKRAEAASMIRSRASRFFLSPAPSSSFTLFPP